MHFSSAGLISLSFLFRKATIMHFALGYYEYHCLDRMKFAKFANLWLLVHEFRILWIDLSALFVYAETYCTG